MKEKAAFITGGTGFIGGRLLRRLLELERFDKIYVLVRRGRNGSANISAQERASVVLADIPEDRRNRITILEGDVRHDRCLLSPNDFGLLERKAQFLECFHAAADIRFDEANRDDIFRTNYTGTRSVLELLYFLGVPRLHYLSTAYVCGDQKGLVREDELVRRNFRNPYEESKFLAEDLIRNFSARTGIETTVYRPSIVVGDSATGVTESFAGYYAYMRGFALLRRDVAMALGKHPEQYHEEGIYFLDGKLRLPLVIWGNPKADINIVCIDYVTDLIARLAVSPSSAGLTFHVVNPKPPKAQWLLEASLNALGITGTHLLDTRVAPDNSEALKRLITKTPIVDALEKQIHSNVRKYIDYSELGPTFSMANVEKILGRIPEHPRVNAELIERFLTYAREKNFGKSAKHG